ncbi:MAG: hypothetical protein L0Y71_05960 [Gemmataceae bacterium]|nr:hypothetical protein [Gemmataceae bacterium]
MARSFRGLRRRLPEIDLVRVQDALPQGMPDPAVLAWAATGSAIDDILLLTEYMPAQEIAEQVIVYLPFRG